MSRIKEPHYFNTDMGNRRITDRTEYESLFPVTPRTRVLAEASTWYLYSDAAVPNILAAYPDARFLAMTRDPVQMAISLFYHNRYKLHEPLEDISEAWAAQERRAAGIGLPVDCEEPAYLQYRAACSLRDLVDRLSARVKPEQLLILDMESLRQGPGEAYRAVLDFIGVADDGRTDFSARNEASQQRSRLLGQAFRHGAALKRKLGLRFSTGITSLNRERLTRKEVPEALIADMTRDLVGQRVVCTDGARRLGISVGANNA